MSFLTKLRTYVRIGLPSVMRVASYRLALKGKVHPAQKLTAAVARPPFFRMPESLGSNPAANTVWDDKLWWFGWHSSPLPEGSPDWFQNPFASQGLPDVAKNWWEISDFAAGDIKGLWELSRFNWLVVWATKAANGDDAALERMNDWLSDWAVHNPPYKGPNWKCGQEASIRVLHLVAAAWLLDQDDRPSNGLIDLMVTHLQRIAPTMSYAIGQQNNHGTSEAAALFVGGSFVGERDKRAVAWTAKGRHWLEDRATSLISTDGSFSQYSVTYHRLMLDTFSLAEVWRRRRAFPQFSPRMRDRLAAATLWLWTLTDAKTGDAPNIGANDGADILPLSEADYRDFRPSVQLAAALFGNFDAFGAGPWNAPLDWFGVSSAPSGASQTSQTFAEGGYHVLRREGVMAVLRFPKFRFRPSQADALHLDVWHEGVNLLRDGGTFSYNSNGGDWFATTAAHNTVEFDRRDQMPRFGRFLFGDWLDAEGVQPVEQFEGTVTCAAGYSDRSGARHFRKVQLSDDHMLCEDVLSGNFAKACLRWRLAPGDWEIADDGLRKGEMILSIEINGKPIVPDLGKTAESRYYQSQSMVPLASVEVFAPATIRTRLVF